MGIRCGARKASRRDKGAGVSGDQRTIFVLGHGYSGRALTRRLLRQGWRAAGTSREAAPGDGVTMFRVAAPRDLAPGTPAAATLLEATHLLHSIPPGPDGDPVLAPVTRLLEEGHRLRWIGYLSTTGVYGDRDGGWVDETTPAAPNNARGERRVRAERQWLDLGQRHGIATQVFRLAGIYGPGNCALDDVRAGTARRILKPGHDFSRIHVEDIAQVLEASIARPRGNIDPKGAIYNVCDDLPAPSADVVSYACELLGVTPPPPLAFAQIQDSLSPMAREFWSANRKVSNALIKSELGVRLLYPDYRSGLRAIFEQGG
jgi:nucleoside-diphosphate-sugar epimerase